MRRGEGRGRKRNRPNLALGYINYYTTTVMNSGVGPRPDLWFVARLYHLCHAGYKTHVKKVKENLEQPPYKCIKDFV